MYPKLHSPKVWFAIKYVAKSNKYRGFYNVKNSKPSRCIITTYKDGVVV